MESLGQTRNTDQRTTVGTITSVTTAAMASQFKSKIEISKLQRYAHMLIAGFVKVGAKKNSFLLLENPTRNCSILSTYISTLTIISLI